MIRKCLINSGIPVKLTRLRMLGPVAEIDSYVVVSNWPTIVVRSRVKCTRKRYKNLTRYQQCATQGLDALLSIQNWEESRRELFERQVASRDRFQREGPFGTSFQDVISTDSEKQLKLAIEGRGRDNY